MKAERNYKAAGIVGRRRDRDLYESTGFHAQQAAEKYLKAYLTLQRIPFYRTHDLTALLNTAAQNDRSPASLAKTPTPLNRFAVAFRYPGAPPRKLDVDRAMRAMERLRAELHRRLGL